jgi:hypothetical protein
MHAALAEHAAQKAGRERTGSMTVEKRVQMMPVVVTAICCG